MIVTMKITAMGVADAIAAVPVLLNPTTAVVPVLVIACAGFDGDQADPRNFNAAQYETRVEGLVEAMEANKQAKEAK